MQVATIEFARHILGTEDANSTEFDSKTTNPVIHILPGHTADEDKGLTQVSIGSAVGLIPSSPSELLAADRVSDTAVSPN